MTNLSDQNALQGERLSEIASRHGVSLEAAMAVFDGMSRSGGRMSQFSHPELGGMGQWSSGMLMIGEFSDSALKQKVQGLCDELSVLTQESTSEPLQPIKSMEPVKHLDAIKPMDPIKHLDAIKPMDPIKHLDAIKPMEPIKHLDAIKPMEPIKHLDPIKSMNPIKPMEPVKHLEPMKPMNPIKPMEPMKPFQPYENIQWWPASLGTPSSVGSQNQSRYAYFPETNRLAIEHNSKVTIFDTGEHKIHGASQAQGDTNSVSFDSQLGRVSLSELTVVDAPPG